VQRFVLDLTGRKPPGPPSAYAPATLYEQLTTGQAMREIRGGDQPQTPSYGGIRG
jgi:hypothetical protein